MAIYMARTPIIPAAIPKLPPSIAPIVGAEPWLTARVVVVLMILRVAVVVVLVVVVVESLPKMSVGDDESVVSAEELSVGVSLGKLKSVVGSSVGSSVGMGILVVVGTRVVNVSESSFLQVSSLVQTYPFLQHPVPHMGSSEEQGISQFLGSTH